MAQWTVFHQRGSKEVLVNRADGLVMKLADAITPLAAATITDALKAMYKENPTLADNLINVSLDTDLVATNVAERKVG